MNRSLLRRALLGTAALLLVSILFIISSGTAAAYNQYTAGFAGINGYGRPSSYAAVMGTRGIYAGGDYPHYYVGTGSRVGYGPRYRYVTQNSWYNGNRYRSTYQPTANPITITSQNLRDRRYPPTRYWDRGAWNQASTQYLGSWMGWR